MKRALLWLGIILPLLSVFFYGAFDWVWWTPMDGPEDNRRPVLFFFHLLTLMYCAASLINEAAHEP